MRQRQLRILLLVLSLVLLALPLVIVHGAGGRIEGKVTDPKGAAVAGAIVTVTDPVSNQNFRASTDSEGRYKVEGLPAGTYLLVVSAKGFSDARRDEVKVEDGAAATVDLKLEIAPVEAAVTVTATKANADPVYQQLRQIGKTGRDFTGPFATVNNLILKRDANVFTLRSGEIYFAPPIEGRVTAAVFIGDGEMTLVPPTPIEKHSLSLFINDEKLTEQFSHLVLRFTDKTFEEVKASPNATMGNGGSQAAKAREYYRDNQQLLRKELRDNNELRTLTDIYAPPRAGFFDAFIPGKKHGKLIFLLDPLGIPLVSPEEVALLSYGDTDGGIWNAFHLEDEYRRGTQLQVPKIIVSLISLITRLTEPSKEQTSRRAIASHFVRWFPAAYCPSTFIALCASAACRTAKAKIWGSSRKARTKMLTLVSSCRRISKLEKTTR